MSTPCIELFYDTASPYSYLAFTQVPALRKRSGVEVRLRAFLLGGVFKGSGNTMPGSVPAKGLYLLNDLERWASYYGVAFSMSPLFPSNSLRAQRTLIAAERRNPAMAERLAAVLFSGYWVEGRDLQDEAFLEDCIQQAGGDLETLLAAPADPEVKASLMAQTQEAIDRGAFGAPTWFLGDDMFWGNDRIGLLEHRLAALRA